MIPLEHYEDFGKAKQVTNERMSQLKRDMRRRMASASSREAAHTQWLQSQAMPKSKPVVMPVQASHQMKPMLNLHPVPKLARVVAVAKRDPFGIER